MPIKADSAKKPATAGKRQEHRQQQRRNEYKEQAEKKKSLSSPTVYEILSREGIEEMERPLRSLWWSGVAAGLAISISLYMMAALRVTLDGVPGAAALEKLGYSFGFLIVILSRLQLFTENTITPILPALHLRSLQVVWAVARLWGVVFMANMVGTFIAGAIPHYLPVAPSEQVQALMQISLHFAERPMGEVFFSAIPAGFLVAVMVWMLPASKGFEFWTILAITFVIAITDTSHVVVGSAELFAVLVAGQTGWFEALCRLLLAGAGNIVGGTFLFSVLAYAQVSREV